MTAKNFECPQCGGYKWGTSRCTANKQEWLGHCHGSDTHSGCGFTWHRATDDEKLLGEPLVVETKAQPTADA